MGDDYETPCEAWKILLDRIEDKTLRIYEPFYCSGRSKRIVEGHGFPHVIHEQRCFFNNPPNPNEYDIILSNPPYSNLPKIFCVLKELDKPWAMLIHLVSISNQYFQNAIRDSSKLQLIIPKKRIHFIREGEGTKRCNFDTAWVCYGLNLPQTIMYA